MASEEPPRTYPRRCECDHTSEDAVRELVLHHDVQDRRGEAWATLLRLIDAAAADGRDTFLPGHEIADELWCQLVTLPPEIGRLKRVRRLELYGSYLSTIPAEIGELEALETFIPYTSRRLHWFPYEITRCRRLKSSIVSTRHLYGNYKNRLPFPRLPAEAPGGPPPVCSVCAGPFAGAPIQVWVSLRVATDVLPLLVHACSDGCIRALPRPPEGYVDHPHRGGRDLQQPAPHW